MIELREALQMVDDLELQAYERGRYGPYQAHITLGVKSDLKARIEELIVYAAQLETRLRSANNDF